jgi:hypothetical protein
VTAAALEKELDAVDWEKNRADFFEDHDNLEKLVGANTRLAVWSRQLEAVDKENPSLCFVREMQAAGHHVAIVTSLALYKIAAASMRGAWDSALYYSYFRTHVVELATQVREPTFYMEKREILDFHKQHTPNFLNAQNRLGLLTRLEQWYGLVSSIVHGQQPGVWGVHQSFADIKYSKDIATKAVTTFAEGVELIHRLLLCTVAQVLWRDFSRTAKRQLLSGLPGDVKAAIGLDTA